MGRIGWSDIRDATFPASQDSARVITKCADGYLSCYGDSVPADGSTGYAPGCIFHHVDGSDDMVLYVNQGNKTSCKFCKLDKVPNAYGTTSGRGPSPGIWHDCPVLEYILNPQEGFHAFEDFILGPNVAAATAVSVQGQMTVYTDANSATIKLLTDETCGAVSLAPGANDDEDAALGFGGATGACYKFDASSPKAFWFETRVKKTADTTNKLGVFIGMIQQGCYAADGILIDTDMATKDLVGFHQIEADTTTIDTIIDTATGTITQVADAAVTIVADTYTKLGMKLDVGAKTLYFYQDGAKLADSIALSGANFPDGERMSPVIAVRSASGTSPGDLTVDWFRVAWEM